MLPDFSHLHLIAEQAEQAARMERQFRAETDAMSLARRSEEALRAQQMLADQAAATLARQEWMAEQVRREQAMAHTAALLHAKEAAARQLGLQLIAEEQFEEAERFARQLAEATQFREIEAYLASIEDSQRFVEQMDQVRRDMTLYLRSFDSNLGLLAHLTGLPYETDLPDYARGAPQGESSRRGRQAKPVGSNRGIPLPFGITLTRRDILFLVLPQLMPNISSGLSINIDRSTHITYKTQVIQVVADVRALRQPRADADTIEKLPKGTKVVRFEGSDLWCPIWPVGKIEMGWVLPDSFEDPEK